MAGEPRLLRYSPAALRVPPGPVARLRSVPGYLRSFRRWLDSHEPAVFQANTFITIPEAITARRAGIPVLMYIHEILPPGPAAPRRGADQGVRGHRDDQHPGVRESSRQERARAPPCLLRSGLPATVPERRRDGRPLVVGTLGVVSRRKGSDIFLAAAEQVQRRLPDVEFRMIGPSRAGWNSPGQRR